MKETFTCQHCHKTFTRYPVRPKYCGMACFERARQLQSNPAQTRANTLVRNAAYRKKKRAERNGLKPRS